MENSVSNRTTLVEYARLVGVEIRAEDTSLEQAVQEFIEFMDDLATLDLGETAPAAIYDPTWSRVNEVQS